MDSMVSLRKFETVKNLCIDPTSTKTTQGYYNQHWRPLCQNDPHITYLKEIDSGETPDNCFTLAPQTELPRRLIKSHSEPTLEIKLASNIERFTTSANSASTEALATVIHETHRIAFSMPNTTEQTEPTEFLVQNNLKEWFIEVDGEREKLPDIGELKTIECIEMTNEDLAFLVVGSENLALIDTSDHPDEAILQGTEPIIKSSMEHGYLSLIQVLIKKNLVNPEHLEISGSSLMHLAISYLQVEILDFLLQQKGIDINKRNNDGDPPLIAAIMLLPDEEARIMEIIDVILQHNPDLEARGLLKKTALENVATFLFHPQITKQLLEKGASPQQVKSLPEVKESMGESEKNQVIEIRKLLTEYGWVEPSPQSI